MNTSKPLNGRVLISDGLGRDSFNTQLLYFTCSSLSADDERIYLISDRDGHPNVWMHDMFRGTDRKLTDNQKGILKSYVYFDGTQDEGLNSYLCVYDTESGALLYEKTIPLCWITHVQFHPLDSDIIMYNHEWSAFDCGIRRVNIYDHHQDIFYHVRTEGGDTKGNPRGYARSRHDWVCHEMWTDDGRSIIYHGGYADGPAMVGRCDIDFTHTDADGLPARSFWEIALPDEYNAYGHFLMDHRGNLTCDGYYRMPGEKIIERKNSTDNGPDPHRKDGAYITKVEPDWDEGILHWVPLCRHDSDWLGQDAHPHPIYAHAGDRIFFNSRMAHTVNVYAVSARTPQEVHGA